MSHTDCGTGPLNLVHAVVTLSMTLIEAVCMRKRGHDIFDGDTPNGAAAPQDEGTP